MRNPLLITGIAALLLAGAALAQIPDTAALIAGAPGEAEYPGADAIVLYDSMTYDVDDAGRLSRRVHRLTKLLTEWACRNLSDVRPSWDATRQELVIHACRTTMRNGEVVDTPPYGFNEVTPDGVARCPDFLSLRETVISHVAVERGAVVELDYEVRDLEPGPLPAGGLEFLQGEWPILTRVVRVSAPGELSYTQLHTDLAPVVTREGARSSVTWTAHDVEGLPLEGNTGHRGDYLPCVAFSTLGDWSALARRLTALSSFGACGAELQDWLDQEGDAFAGVVPDLSARDTVERVAHLLGERLRTVQASGPWVRAPRPPDQVFASSYGTPWEKAVLALHLLRAAGLQPELAFFTRWETLAAEAPTLASFSDLRVVVRVGDEQFWLSPDGGVPIIGRCDLAGRTGMFLEDTPKGYRKYTVPRPESTCVLAVDVRPDDAGGFSAEIDLALTSAFRLADRDRDAVQMAEVVTAAVLPGAEIRTTRVLDLAPHVLHLRLTARADSLGRVVGEGLLVTLPAPPHDLLDLLPAACRLSAGRRATPLFPGGPLREEIRWRLTLPAGLVVDRPVPAADLEADLVGYHQSCRQQGQVVEVRRSLEVSEGSVAPAAWPAFRAVLAAAAAPAARELVLLPE